MKRTPRQTCLDCHFFVKTFEQKNVFVLMDNQREYIRSNGNLGSHDRLSCYMGVWDEDVNDFKKENRYNIITNTERKDFCFFWKYTPGMLLPAAKILQEREAANKAAARDRRLTILGLWIAALALLGNLGIGIASFLLKKP